VILTLTLALTVTLTLHARHPWLREGGDAPDTVLDDTVLTRLKKFSGMNKLKKMALNVIAKNMSKHEIEGLSEMFKAFDKDNSGTITLSEMKEGLKKMGNPLGEAEVEAMMQQIDVDGNGEISYEEFIAATMVCARSDPNPNPSPNLNTPRVLVTRSAASLPTDNSQQRKEAQPLSHALTSD
jgi:hypothetical protein